MKFSFATLQQKKWTEAYGEIAKEEPGDAAFVFQTNWMATCALMEPSNIDEALARRVSDARISDAPVFTHLICLLVKIMSPELFGQSELETLLRYLCAFGPLFLTLAQRYPPLLAKLSAVLVLIDQSHPFCAYWAKAA